MKPYSDIVKNIGLSKKIQDHKTKLVKLCEKELYTEAFVSSYILAEYISMQLIQSYQPYQETKILTDRVNKRLIKFKDEITIDQEQLETLIFSSILPREKEKARSKRNRIDVSIIRKALNELDIQYDPFKINYLLSDKLPQTSRSILPDNLDSMTIRVKRNNVVHRNEEVSKDYYSRINLFFSYFFDLIESAFPVDVD